ncbi:apolipoprotein N-acyltransferase [Pendulispora albinea]|uniref:Apolipoprotein N-acyltransferase n=1 Tax=Pendulispora albinea TaxID=2741071 RepID=A0ABZ2MCD0_9BACT
MKIPLPVLPALGLSALSGFLYFLAFAGMDIWPLAFVAFVPLWIALRGQRPRFATWLGLCTGTTMNVFGFYWLLNMLKTFSGFPTPLCMLFVLIICSYQGGRLAFMGWLYARAALRGWPAALVFVGAFAVSELLFPLLFPWYYAATVHGQPALTQIADLGGPILIGVVLVLVNLAIAEPLLARIEKRPWDKRLVQLGGGALLVTLVYGYVRIRMVDAKAAESERLNVGLVQANMGLMQKREDPGEGLRRHLKLSRELREHGADLLVWSESSVTAPVLEHRADKVMYERVGSQLGLPAIFGAVLYRFDSDRDRWFNTALSTDTQGHVTARYDKEFLLAFGEYLPFGDTFPILYQWSPNSGKFTPGTKLDPLLIRTQSGEHKVTALICYEDILPGFTNRAVGHADPELLVNITNDAWFGDTSEPWEHLGLAQFRAIEHHRYLVRSTNSGVSAVVDPVGRVIAHSGTFRAETVQASVRWMRGLTVYEVVGDIPWYLLSLAMAYAAFRKRPVRSTDSANLQSR